VALEDLTGTKYIDSLVATNPVGVSDPKSEGDNHIRGIKNTLLLTFPNTTGPITATQTELNHTVGLTSAAVGVDNTQTLTNKTLTAPIISTISNTGTITLPTTTDTLVGKATTDTFTNKSISGDQIDSGTLPLARIADSSLPGEKLEDATTGDFIESEISAYTLTGQSTAYAKYLEFKVGRDGTYNVRINSTSVDHSASGTTEMKIYVGGVAAGTERSQSHTGVQDNTWNEDIAVSEGDLIQLYSKYTTAGPYARTVNMYVMSANPVGGVARNVNFI